MKQGDTADTARALKRMRNIVNHLGGYHRCYLESPIHLEFVSDNFCAMLGYTRSELSQLTQGIYTILVYPDDVPVFGEFVMQLAGGEVCESVSYRLMKKDGSVIRVVDTMASIIGEDGHMRGYSVVCEIPDDHATQEEQDNARIALLKVSGGGSLDAHIEQMCGIAKTLLGIKGDGRELLLFEFVSLTDRPKVEAAMRRAYLERSSGMESCTLVSACGKGYDVDFWVERICDEGSFEESVFCIKIETDLDYKSESKEIASFRNMLFSSFAEDVFEIDRAENSVRHICRSEKGPIKAPCNVRMNADDFLEWFVSFVSDDEKDRVREFCLQAIGPRHAQDSSISGPEKIVFSMTKGSDSARYVALVMVPVSKTKYFMCLNEDFTSLGTGFCAVAVAERKRISVRLFGSFGLSVDGEAIHIRSDKGRELLALLVEKRGAYLTTREAITTLWECEPDDASRARYRKVASRLMSELKKHDIDYIVESERGARRIVPEFIECDYYEYRDGLSAPSGAFLPEYAWSEYVRLD